MARFNFQKKCVECRIVYYGPGFCGKTTNLQVIYEKAPTGVTGELSSIATKDDRTLFFDFMPMDLGKVAGLSLKFLLYTVPGQVYYNNTRKLVLQAVDGIIFVADSDKAGAGKMPENIQSLENLRENLLEQGRSLDDIPVVLQYNKRDLPEVYSIEELNEKLNTNNWPHVEATAFKGDGVFQTIKVLSKIMVERLNQSNTSSLEKMPPLKVNSLTPGSDVEINLESIVQPPLPKPEMTKVVVQPTGRVNLNQTPQPFPSSTPPPPPPPPQPTPLATSTPTPAPVANSPDLIQALQSLVAGGGSMPNLIQQMGSNYKPDGIMKALQNMASKKGTSFTLERLHMKPEEFDSMMKTYGEASVVKGFSQSKFVTDYEQKK